MREAEGVEAKLHYFWIAEDLGEGYAVLYNSKTAIPFHEVSKELPLPVVLILKDQK